MPVTATKKRKSAPKRKAKARKPVDRTRLRLGSFSTPGGKRAFCYRKGRVVFSGVHRFLHKEFLPPNADAVRAGMHGDGTNHRGAKRMGISTGRQVAKWANGNGRVFPPGGGNRFFKAIVDALNTWKLTPVAGEFLVNCDKMRVATGVDLVTSRADGSIVLVEIKCGSNGIWDSPMRGKLRGPPVVRAMPNTAKYHAILQAAITHVVYARHARVDSKTVTSFVLHVTNSVSQFKGAARVDRYTVSHLIVSEVERHINEATSRA